MSKTILHKADSRGHANHGWLNSYHSFSFSGYYNPERINFGALRVLNDDEVDGGRGFGAHPHDNMEIISIPLEGDLEHQDNLGHKQVIRHGDIQVISAGTGVFHSEYNKNKDKKVKFLQIWLFPNKKNVTPRYDQVTLSVIERKNKFQQVLSPNPDDEGVWLHQDAWFNLGNFDKDITTEYNLKKEGNGVYAFVIEGSATIKGQELNRRDALGVWETDKLEIKANSDNTQILLMDIPMEVQ